VPAYAKVNLTLEILARRDDGMHALRSVMLPIALADEFTFEPAPNFSITADTTTPLENDLVTRATQRIGASNAPISITFKKNIPIGAGLGGGSSDAAEILRAGMSGTFGNLGERDWLADASALGSDVPFFLTGGAALVEGTGERVTALGALPPWWVVLLVPKAHVSTAGAYQRLAESRATSPAATRPRNESASLRALIAIQRANYDDAIAAAINDFEPIITAEYPPVAEALNALREANAEHAMLSGSGGACFSLTRDEISALALAERINTPPGAQLHVVPLAPSDAWRAATLA
jgi:4-diphosphocytidyl-2-C-methyl-D-erythritol kinase